jgi:hypothetical protein
MEWIYLKKAMLGYLELPRAARKSQSIEPGNAEKRDEESAGLGVWGRETHGLSGSRRV